MTPANGAQILASPSTGAVDAAGRPIYRMAVVSNQLASQSFQTNTSVSTANSDVWQMMFSFRDTFN